MCLCRNRWCLFIDSFVFIPVNPVHSNAPGAVSFIHEVLFEQTSVKISMLQATVSVKEQEKNRSFCNGNWCPLGHTYEATFLSIDSMRKRVGTPDCFLPKLLICQQTMPTHMPIG